MLAVASRQARRDAELLLRHVFGRDRAWLLAHPDALLTPDQKARYDDLLARRMKHEPVQYILGEQEFYGLRLRVTPAVLIPRPETEHLVEAVLERMARDRAIRIADVGTGSGAIAVALAHLLPRALVDALDLSGEALEVARDNARTHAVESRVSFFCSDLLAAVAGEHYDCIVANPPYVPSGEELEPQVANWEPRRALFAGEDGLAVYRRLMPEAAEGLRAGGLLALEIGAGQRARIAGLFRSDARWASPTFLPDLQGIPRVVLAERRT